MPMTDIARDVFADAVTGGASFTRYNNANAHIGVGDGTTAFASTQTDLQGANRFRRPMDATFPTRTANQIQYRATYAAGEANFAWQERGIFNALSGGQMLNRKVVSLGTKASPQQWVFTCTDTVVLV